MSAPAGFESPQNVFAWAEGFTNLEKGRLPSDKRNYRLDRMSRLLDALGRPESAYGTIHVAGTKGKGSTSALLASVLSASGQKTGLYTSPHVETPLERIMIDGRFPDPMRFVETGRALRDAVERLQSLPGGFPPTTFELYTVLAFLCFRDEGCASAVIETGIGGRLDATNVILPEASVITPLDLEHTDILGDTLEKIAAEKAGIIKEGTPVFSAPQAAEARAVFREAAARAHAPLAFVDDELETLDVSLEPGGTSFRLMLKGEKPRSFRLSMRGAFQAENAALAYLTLRRVRPGIAVEAYARGFAAASLPGRMEVVRRAGLTVVLDGAHTPLAVRRLLESFNVLFPGGGVLIFGSVAGKKTREMAEILAPAFPQVVISTPGTFKTSDPEEVYRIFRALNPAALLEWDPGAALEAAQRAAGGAAAQREAAGAGVAQGPAGAGIPILVTGSFYMVAEIRRRILEGGGHDE